MNKRSLVVVMAVFSPVVWAADFVDTARVVSSTPIYERVSEPKQECWTETINTPAQERSMGGAVVGGVAGGLLGSQVGGGSGNTAATAAGAIAGTMVGDSVSNPGSANRSSGGAIIGGVAGGLLGSQVGSGSGRNAATAAGAILGTIVGDRVANPAAPQAQQVQRCRQVENYHEVISGYNVVYRYNGREVTTRLPYQPGATIQVGVNLNVLDDGSARDAGSQGYRGRSEDRRRDYRQEDRRGED
ncbi:MAG: glycine zipper 2TM domain-containing protein [Sideroxydans sp.]|nr:glycine zipper 2TM domain-containing protein [Sideroxydans sp.]